MTDLQLLKARRDLRPIVEADLGPSHNRNSRVNLWHFLFHPEHEGVSLALWYDSWPSLGLFLERKKALSDSGSLKLRRSLRLRHYKTLLTVYEIEEAGINIAARLQALIRRAQDIQVPWIKTFTKFVLIGERIRK